VSAGTATSSITINEAATSVGVGATANGDHTFPGYIANARIVKGTALYTAAFTPPTQLLNITNTSLLTCNSPAIVDQSSNAFAITTNGNAAASTFTPFTAYVPYNPALGASTPGVWTVDEAMQARQTRQWNMYDPYFNLTTLLLHGNGTNGAQNNTFLDSSSNAFTITRNGNTTQGTFSPFSQTGWSNFFDGTGDYLSAAANAAFQFGTGNFTIEFWYYPTVFGTNTQIDMGYVTPGAYVIQNAADGIPYFYNNPAGYIITASTGYVLNKWNHLAVTRSGTTVSMFLNGARVGTATNSSNFNANFALGIGGSPTHSQPNEITGYLSNVRLVKGTAVYDPTLTALTIPTAPFAAISGTSILTCQSNRFVDNSLNAFAITINGTPSVQAFSPFLPTDAYSAATVGGSGYLDGTGDYLSIADNAAFDLSNGDFTIEAWIYGVSGNSTQYATICTQSIQNGTSNTAYFFSTGTTGSTLYVSTGGSSWSNNIESSSGGITNGQWFHYAWQRRSNTLEIYRNGVLQTVTSGSSSFSGTVFNSSRDVWLGAQPGASGGSANAFNGYICNLRFVKGAAVYTGNFTPPIAPLSTSGSASSSAYSSTTNVNTSFASSACSLLTNFTNAGITDATAKNNLETVGNAQISTTQSKFGGSSMYFDGTGDNLLTTPTPLLNFGASDFTIEFWIYPASTSAGSVLYSTSSRAKADVLALVLSGGSVLVYITASGGSVWSITSGSNAGSLTTNTWQHVALVRSGSSFRGYVNGVLGFTVTSSSAVASMDGFSIGSNGASADYLNGYLDDLRITRYARYTAAFTPQTSQWQDE